MSATTPAPAKRDVAYELNNITSTTHDADNIPGAILARLNRYAEEMRVRRVYTAHAPHWSHISEDMSMPELAATLSGLARAYADALDERYPAKAGKGR